VTSDGNSILRSGRIDEEIRAFQELHRDRFRHEGAEEFKLSQTESHKEFCDLVDRHLAEFCKQAGVDEVAVAEAVARYREDRDPRFRRFASLLGHADFRLFAELLRNNICLTTGEPFRGEPITMPLIEA